MTHTLHRRGSPESLSGDYVMLMIQAVGYNEEDHVRKVQEFLRIAVRHNAVNIGSVTGGGMIDRADEVIANAQYIGQAAFASQDEVTAVLKELKEADLGLSVVVSGIFEKVDECLQRAGLQHHTANFSLGIWGKTERLPSDDILAITTMCGHGMISTNIVKKMANEVRAETKTPEEAAKLLAPACACGVFNTIRTAKLLRDMADK